MIRRIGTLVFLALLGCVRQPPDAGYYAFSLRVADKMLAAGVSSAELTNLAGITRICGMVFDRGNRDIILVGRARSDLPAIPLEDLAVALRARLRLNEWPMVTIDFGPQTQQTGMQSVRFAGGIENSSFGRSFLESDLILKRYSLGLLEPVAGVHSYLSLYESAVCSALVSSGNPVTDVHWFDGDSAREIVSQFLGDTSGGFLLTQSRFWFYPRPDRSFVVERDDVFAINELSLGVRTELMMASNGDTVDAAGDAFARLFTDSLQRIYAQYPVLKRLKGLFDLVAVAEGIVHLGPDRPEFDHVLQVQPSSAHSTPDLYPVIERIGLFGTRGQRAVLVQLSGGVDLKAVVLALQDGDVSALKRVVLASRPDSGSLFWALPLAGWKMPNDDTDFPPPRVNPRSNRLSCALVAQRYAFRLPPNVLPGQPGAFRGFCAPPVMPPPVPPRFMPVHTPRLGGVAVNPQPRGSDADLEETRDRILRSRPDSGGRSWRVTPGRRR